MCRIAGALSFGQQDLQAQDIERMRDTMVAGGPDDAGLWLSPNHKVGFGHRRLSILDLSAAGHQPMHTPCGRYTICYNGEIYNFREVRAELQAQGLSFKSDCDTEVLLHAFAVYGLAALPRFHGMWAFAIWDAHAQVLTLARDRIGVKPLYYALQGNLFWFGSELKSIMAHPQFTRTLNPEALQLFLAYSYVPAPYAIVQDAYKLQPGQWLTINMQGGIEVGTWWHPTQIAGINMDWANTRAVEDELENRMTTAFEQRLVADVPVGVFLSGGIDSSLLLALLRRRLDKPVQTFTIGFDESAFNEAHHAKRVAQALGSSHHELYLKPERGLDIIDQLPHIWDEPFGDNSAIATHLVSQFAVQHVKVALSADGGDELFCGYPKYWLTLQRVAAMQRHPWLCKTIAAMPAALLEWVGRLKTGNKLLKVQDLAPHVHGSPQAFAGHAFGQGQHVFSRYQLQCLLGPAALAGCAVEGRAIEGRDLPQMAHWGMGPQTDALSAMMMVDLMSYHADDIHVKVDRASMANALEAREPFLDHTIVEFALAMPSALKLPHNNPNQSKNILRSILYRHIDRSLIERPKMGFGVPLDRWLNHELAGLVEGLLNPKALQDQGLFNPGYVQALRASFARNPQQELNKIWNLMVFCQWQKTWLN